MGFVSQIVLFETGNFTENTAVSRIRLHRSTSHLKGICRHMAPKFNQVLVVVCAGVR